ncbi:hypothetical protein [Paracoccus pantotrophus]|uniref:hypothetical protein n=1 Tax=Paracoccus pantotrophus TaxID=82367 RepID=UPI001160A0C4|nr:hypothetical protein [Paracoccus pantotrophus]
MYQYIILARYSVAEFTRPLEHILGVRFSPVPVLCGQSEATTLFGHSDNRLFYLYDATGPLPVALGRIIAAAPHPPPASVLMGMYSSSHFTDHRQIAHESEVGFNQVMLNFVSDPGALVLVRMESAPTATSTSVEVSFETYEPHLHAMSGVQVVNPHAARRGWIFPAC